MSLSNLANGTPTAALDFEQIHHEPLEAIHPAFAGIFFNEAPAAALKRGIWMVLSVWRSILLKCRTRISEALLV